MSKKRKCLKGLTNANIAREAGLRPNEISLALSGKRLLNRNKLRQIYDAGYAVEPFVFGLAVWNKMYKCSEIGV